jgi:hypothetical protein
MLSVKSYLLLLYPGVLNVVLFSYRTVLSEIFMNCGSSGIYFMPVLAEER